MVSNLKKNQIKKFFNHFNCVMLSRNSIKTNTKSNAKRINKGFFFQILFNFVIFELNADSFLNTAFDVYRTSQILSYVIH